MTVYRQVQAQVASNISTKHVFSSSHRCRHSPRSALRLIRHHQLSFGLGSFGRLTLRTEVFKGSKSWAGLSSSVLQQCQAGPPGPSLVPISATRVQHWKKFLIKQTWKLETGNWVNILFPMLVFGAECYHSPRALKCLIHCHNCFIWTNINLSSKRHKIP